MQWQAAKQLGNKPFYFGFTHRCLGNSNRSTEVPTGRLYPTLIMSIQNEFELNAMKTAGVIVRAALNAMQVHVAPGITTRALNDIGAEVLAKHGARSAPKMVYGFPADICISLNEEIVHGIPSERVVKAGDLVKLDVVAEKDGFMADAAVTVVVGPAEDRKYELVECAKRAFYKAMSVVRAGNRVNHIGRAVEQEVKQSGFSVVEDLAGHGVGRTIHEDPTVPNVYSLLNRKKLTNGLVIAVEPMVAMGSGAVYEADDGWTISTRDHSLTAHFEHTVMVTKGNPVLLTA